MLGKVETSRDAISLRKLGVSVVQLSTPLSTPPKGIKKYKEKERRTDTYSDEDRRISWESRREKLLPFDIEVLRLRNEQLSLRGIAKHLKTSLGKVQRSVNRSRKYPAARDCLRIYQEEGIQLW